MPRKNESPVLRRIKDYAKKLKTEKAISHCQALDQAAKECGYNTYAHFLSVNK